MVVQETNLTPHLLTLEIDKLIANKALREKMAVSAKAFAKPDAGKVIAREVINIALSHEK